MVVLDHIFQPTDRMSPKLFVYYSALWGLNFHCIFPGCLFRLQTFLHLSSLTDPLFALLDELASSQYTDASSPDSGTDSSQKFQHNGSRSKPQSRHRATDQTKHHSHDVQSDQLQRGVVLGPPGSPQEVKSLSQAQKDDRLNNLEKRLEELARMLDMVKAQVATGFGLVYSILPSVKNIRV